MRSRTFPLVVQLSVVLFLVATTAPSWAQKQSKKVPATGTAARIQKKTYDFQEAGKKMDYSLFVPSRYDKEKKTPLIVTLHGLGGTPDAFLRYRGLTDLAEKYNYILVAPMGYNSKGWYGSKGPSSPKDVPKNLGELSEKDVMNVLALTRKEYNIDERRIYLAGHSMGGGGTFHLAFKYPDLWAALAPIAPAIFRKPDELQKIKHIPIIVIQGDKDNLVPVAGTRRWVDKMKELKMTHEYVEIAGGDHGNVAFTGMPKIFEFFEKHSKQVGK